MKRPTSLTVVSVLLILFGGFGLFGAFNALRLAEDPQYAEIIKRAAEASSLPLSVQQAVPFVGAAIMLTAGFASLNGMGWGRWLYVGWMVAATLLSIVTSPSYAVMAIPSVVLTAIFAFFFFRPAANAYFRGAQEEHEQST